MEKDARPLLLEEILRLKEEVRVREKQLKGATQLLKDILTRGGPYTDEELGMVAFLEPMYRNTYDVALLKEKYPALAKVVIQEQVDGQSMEQMLLGGIITGSELEAEGIKTKTMISRALRIKPLKRYSPYSTQERVREELE